MKSALLIVDVQNDYFPGGKNELVNSIEASYMAKKLLEAFRKKQLPVIHIQHISTRVDASYFIPDTVGVQFNENVQPLPGEVIIKKHTPNSFKNTELLDTLKTMGVDGLIICGMMTHMCIDSTTRAAFDNGLDCIVVHDACATKNLVLNDKTICAEDVHTSFLAALNGMFAKVLSTEQVLRQIEI
jgi:nicotinamidase-related amidase